MKKFQVVDNIVVNSITVDTDNIPDWCVDWPSDEDFPSLGIHDELVNDAWVNKTQRPAYMEPLVRRRRDDLLLELDNIVSNPLRWSQTSPEKQAEWTTYRQALLDIPQQAGFPTDITWPTKPE